MVTWSQCAHAACVSHSLYVSDNVLWCWVLGLYHCLIDFVMVLDNKGLLNTILNEGMSCLVLGNVTAQGPGC